MARNNHIQNSFVAGEASPKFAGRTETPQYNQTCREIKNAIVFAQGGASRRTGTIFKHDIIDWDAVASAPSATRPVGARLFPFSAADGTKWQLLLTTNKPDIISAASLISWKGIKVDSEDEVAPGAGFTLAVNFVPTANPLGAGLFSDYYIFTQAQLDEIQYAQAGNIIYFVHPDFRPFRMVYDGSQFAMTVVGFHGTTNNNWRHIPYEPSISNLPSSPNVGGIQITDNTTYWSLAWSIVTLPAAGLLLGALGVGDVVKLSDSTFTALFLIQRRTPGNIDGVFLAGGHTGFTTGTIFGNAANSDSSFEFPIWSKYNKYPRTVAFFESRLLFGGSEVYPDSLWFSQLNDVEEFDLLGLRQDVGYADPVVATDAFDHVLKSNAVNSIQWVSTGKTITVGTGSDEFILEGPDATQTMGPTNAASRSESVYGSPYIKSIRVENATAFVQRHGESIRELVYNYTEEAYQGVDLNIIGEHISTRSIGDLEDVSKVPNYDSGIKQIAMQYLPTPIIWAIDGNSKLIGCTRERGQEISAWHHHELGYDTESDEYAEVVSISSLQRPTPVLDTGVRYGKQEDQLWMVVKRQVGTGTAPSISYQERLYVEAVATQWQSSKIELGWEFDLRGIRAPIFMDCAVLADSADYTDGVITGLPHGNGAIVSVVCNGFWFGNYTVVGGSINISNFLTSPSEVFKAIVGFNYEAVITPVTPEVPARQGTSMDLPRRVDQVMLHFYRTLGCKFGRKSDPNEGNTPTYATEEIAFEIGNTTVNPQLYTGVKVVNIPGSYERRPEITVVSHLPFPFTLTHMTYRMTVHE